MSATKPSNETFRAELKEEFDSLREETLASLGAARELQLAARALMERESARMARKHGADAPRVQALKAQAQARVEVARAIEVEAQIAAVRVPRVEKNDALLHGRLTDAALNGVAGLSVKLVNERGEPVKDVTEARTDAQGYYAFVLKPEQAEALASEKLSVAIAHEGETLKPTQPAVVLQPGAALLHELKLSDDELVRLKLRAAPDRPTPASTAAKPTGRPKKE